MSTTSRRKTFCSAEQECLVLVCVPDCIQEITYHHRSDSSRLEGEGGEREGGKCEDLHCQNIVMLHRVRRAMIGHTEDLSKDSLAFVS